jgi:hypothetical protein
VHGIVPKNGSFKKKDRTDLEQVQRLFQSALFTTFHAAQVLSQPLSSWFSICSGEPT